jgi:uncharacterized protein (DUF433 family)
MNEYVETRDGGYWIKGKRISLDSVVYAFHRGQSPESIRQSFPLLTLEEIYGAITFYLANRDDVDRNIHEDDAAFEELHRQSKEQNAAVYARIEKARSELTTPK